MKSKITLTGVRAAVEIEINARMPELRGEIQRGVSQALSKLEVARVAAAETREVMNEILSTEVRAAISEVADRVSREELKTATRDVVESMFREWLTTRKNSQSL